MNNIKYSYDYLFLSPHLDDVVLSCGGLIWQLTNSGAKVLVVTVAAGDPDYTKLSPLAEKAHKLWGLKSGAMAHRRQEDVKACAQLGADFKHLPIQDCVYRRDTRSGRELYTTQSDIFGLPCAEDLDLGQALPSMLLSLPVALKTFAPAGIGGHVDHEFTRLIARAVFGSKLMYYEDFPYCEDDASARFIVEREPDLESESIPLTQTALMRKIRSIEAYASQVKPIFRSLDLMRSRVRQHAQEVGGERYWKLGNQKEQNEGKNFMLRF